RRARAEQKDSPDPQRGPCQAARPGWTAAFGSPASLPWHRPPHCAAVEASSKGLTLPHPRGVPQILDVAGAAETVLGVVDRLFGPILSYRASSLLPGSRASAQMRVRRDGIDLGGDPGIDYQVVR